MKLADARHPWWTIEGMYPVQEVRVMFYYGVPPLLFLFNDKILVLVNQYFPCWVLLSLKIQPDHPPVTFALEIKYDFTGGK